MTIFSLKVFCISNLKKEKLLSSSTLPWDLSPAHVRVEVEALYMIVVNSV